MASKEIVQRTLRGTSSAAIGLERATDDESQFVGRLPNYDEELCTERVKGLLEGEITRLQNFLKELRGSASEDGQEHTSLQEIQRSLELLGMKDQKLVALLAACDPDYREHLLRTYLAATRCPAGDWHYISFGCGAFLPKEKQPLMIPIVQEAMKNGNYAIARDILIAIATPSYPTEVCQLAISLQQQIDAHLRNRI
ncbi:MAG: hypothetical protein G01um101425_890 [Candidatus Peregrinibacteria bacterium Gr01-1014_25]|nr:MAG: hypothetical protein G01um101425_890 [Candidatus Peregrinibacteria bacterium Gr01-1014_25]